MPVFSARRRAAWLGLGLVALSLAGCASTYIVPSRPGENSGSSAAVEPTVAPTTSALQIVAALPAPAASDGSIGPIVRLGDTIKVDVFGVEELGRTARVDSAGQITLDLIGKLDAAGLTLGALETRIRDLYGERYLQNPQVTLTLEQTVTLDGEFRKAGSYAVAADSSLLRLVAEAGNFTEIGDPTQVFVYRTVGGVDYVARFDVADIRSGRRADVPVYGGDIVVAFPSGMKVLGANLSSALGLARSATILF